VVTESIKAGEKAVNDVFCDKYLLRIPPYQRPYAWTTEQASELLSDLLYATAHSPPASPIPYFLGSIVLIKGPNSPDADVVDGQQRLTTLTILLCVLRDFAQEAKLSATIDKYIRQEGNPLISIEDKFRLTPRERDAEFFATRIQAAGATKNLPSKDGLPESQQRMVENATLFREKVAQLSEGERTALITYIVAHSYLVTVEASDAASAYRIFSVMNARGLDLSPTDILKAEIIGSIPVAKREQFTEKWEDIEEMLGREKFRDLFGHIRMIYRRSKMRGSLESEFREAVKPQNDPIGFVDNVLRPLANAYLAVCNQDYSSTSNAEVINTQLKYLSRIDNYDWEAPTIRFMSKKDVKPEDIAAFLLAMEKLAYGLFIIRADINERVTRYGKVIDAVEAGGDLYAADSPLLLSQVEKAKARATLDGALYEELRIRLPVLLRLDQSLSGGGASYDHKIITVEHILPQNPDPEGEWCVLFPDEILRQNWVHRLGNLALLTRAKNSQASNWTFDRKKSEYFVKGGISPFTLTTQVLQEPEWNLHVMEKRQKELVDRLCAVWGF
jgi:uncharacterized protein with ParB-like and HNH nuclease domain